jgi:uncharacterized membrane protein YjfL (UPF0719 family)
MNFNFIFKCKIYLNINPLNNVHQIKKNDIKSVNFAFVKYGNFIGIAFLIPNTQNNKNNPINIKNVNINDIFLVYLFFFFFFLI